MCLFLLLNNRQERQRYYANRQISIEKPREFLSIIIDGMDQNKTNVPRMVRVPKSCQNIWNLRTHLTRALVHGRGSYRYFDFQQFPHDCNLTLTNTLVNLNGSIPRKLLLQFDNCVRENKNKYVMAFMAWLVEADFFIEMSYRHSL